MGAIESDEALTATHISCGWVPVWWAEADMRRGGVSEYKAIPLPERVFPMGGMRNG